MPKKSKRGEFAPHIDPDKAPACAVEGCDARGTYKAPQSRDRLHDYHWFCLDHIREHNLQWDYFNGMDSAEIESFRKDAVTGHRPTWSRENGLGNRQRQLYDALYEFLHDGKPAPKPQPPLSAKLRKALAALDMSYPFTPEELKARYRAMAKKHHPDMNRGNKQSEELFKRIAVAYRTLSDHIKDA